MRARVFFVDIINLLKEIKSTTFTWYDGAPLFYSFFSLLSYYFVIIHLSAKYAEIVMNLCPCILHLLFVCLHIVVCRSFFTHCASRSLNHSIAHHAEKKTSITFVQLFCSRDFILLRLSAFVAIKF